MICRARGCANGRFASGLADGMRGGPAGLENRASRPRSADDEASLFGALEKTLHGKQIGGSADYWLVNCQSE